MRALAFLLVVAMIGAGCIKPGQPSEEEDEEPALPDPIHDAGTIESGRQFTRWNTTVEDNVTATAEFTSDAILEYARIAIQDCHTQAGSSTGYVYGGDATHKEDLAPGTACFLVETRHSSSFNYTFDVTFRPA